MHRREFLAEIGGVTAMTIAARTARAQEVVEPFYFCVVADPHCNEGPREGMEALGTGVDRFMLCVEKMAASPEAEKPDFLLIAGDLHVKAFLPLIAKVPFPMHVTPGNHEASAADRKALREAFPEDFQVDGAPSDYYAFTHKGVRFISMCDAGMGGEHIGTLCSETIQPRGQCEWLERELAGPESRKILFAHIPAQQDGEDREMHLNRNDSRWFNALAHEKNPAAIFFGHLHQPTHTYKLGAADVWRTRSCCWNMNNAPTGFLHVRVDADGVKVNEILTWEPGG